MNGTIDVKDRPAPTHVAGSPRYWSPEPSTTRSPLQWAFDLTVPASGTTHSDLP
ncbi:MAG: hypothetical protein ACLQRH_23310 [Acidimicrobiales bacterium]